MEVFGFDLLSFDWAGLLPFILIGFAAQMIDGALGIATVMSATGSFDHRAIDGADGAQLMEAFKNLCENPMGLVV